MKKIKIIKQGEISKIKVLSGCIRCTECLYGIQRGKLWCYLDGKILIYLCLECAPRWWDAMDYFVSRKFNENSD